MTTNRISIAAATVLAAGLLLTGCSANGAGSDPSSSATSGAGTTKQQAAKWDEDFKKCFEEAGFDVDDPELQGPGRPKAADDAKNACEEKLGERPSQVDPDDPAVKAAAEASTKAADECFEDLGYKDFDKGANVTPDGATEADMDKCMTASNDAYDKAYKDAGGK